MAKLFRSHPKVGKGLRRIQTASVLWFHLINWQTDFERKMYISTQQQQIIMSGTNEGMCLMSNCDMKFYIRDYIELMKSSFFQV